MSSQSYAVEPGCVHRWMIDPPEGASSLGMCRNCGETRRFTNHFDNKAIIDAFEEAKRGSFVLRDVPSKTG